MLSLSKFLKTQNQAWRVALVNLRQQPLVTFITALMIGFILTWPTFLWVLTMQAKSAITQWHHQAFFSFYLPNTVDEKIRNDIIQRLQSMQELESIRVISPKQALQRLLSHADGVTVATISKTNPLPYVIEIRPKSENFTAKGLAAFYQKISQIPYLQGSKNNLNWFARLAAFEQFLNHFMLLLLVILMIGVTFLISNTLRMVIHMRYEEIQVQKLVGATNRYILVPFLYTGAAYGVLGGVFSVLIVDIAIIFLQEYFQPLATLYDYVGHISWVNPLQILVIVGTALILGWTAAWIFVRHYLSKIEPV